MPPFDGIGGPDRVGEYLAWARDAGIEPPGFGHRVYKTYDPRARILKELATTVVATRGGSRLFETALALEEAAAKDEHFLEQAYHPTVDFYEAIVYQALGFPTEMFPVLFAIPRFIGWAAQWEEMMRDPEQSTYRPRQIYVGAPSRPYVALDERGKRNLRDE